MKRLFLLFSLGVITFISSAQIPNGGFENWTQVGTYWTPDNWGCLNSITAPLNVFTCERGTPGSPGNYFLKITSKTVAGVGVMPGIVVSGTLDDGSFTPTNGFPFTQRPTKLSGKWQHMIFGSSQGYVSIELSKWNTATNSRDIIGSGVQPLVGMAMSWANFNINITYQSTDNPDSCMIVFAASGANPTNLDYLWIDNLSFAGLTGIESNETVTANLKIYPNPASNYFSADYTCISSGKGEFSITDMNGNVVYSKEMMFNAGKNSINLSLTSLNLSAGTYIAGVLNNNKLLQQRLVIR